MVSKLIMFTLNFRYIINTELNIISGTRIKIIVNKDEEINKSEEKNEGNGMNEVNEVNGVSGVSDGVGMERLMD